MAFRRRIVPTASEDRLEQLVQARIRPGADKAAIDRRIWDLFGEEWCVMFTDLSGFSRRVAKFGIIHFLQTIHEAERLLVPVIEDHDGILLKVEGDSFLVIFRSVRRALDGAVAMQRIVKDYNAGRPAEEHVLLCVGLGFGKVLRIGDADVFGGEVNAASKLGEDTARSWEILATDAVRRKAGRSRAWSFAPIRDVPPGAKRAFKVRYEL